MGIAGIVMMFDRLIECQDPGLNAAKAQFEEWRQQYIRCIAKLITSYKYRREITFHEGIASGYAILAVHYHKVGDTEKSKKFIQKIIDLHSVALQTESNEILYGKAGYLLAVLYTNKHIPNAIPKSVISRVYQTIIKEGLRCALQTGLSTNFIKNF